MEQRNTISIQLQKLNSNISYEKQLKKSNDLLYRIAAKKQAGQTFGYCFQGANYLITKLY